MPNESQTLLVKLVESPAHWWPPSAPSFGDWLVVLSLIFGIVSYIINQRLNRKNADEELAWKRMAFLFEEAKLFDTDPDISEAVRIITGNNLNFSIEELFEESPTIDADIFGVSRHRIDKMMNLLERIAYSVENKTLKMEDAAIFDWYFDQVCNHKTMRIAIERFYPNTWILGAKLDLRRSANKALQDNPH